MATRLHGRHTVTVLLALLVLVPASVSYAQNQDGKVKQVENFIELAERAKEKTEILINMTYLNETAMASIIGEGLDVELDANVEEFNKAVLNITNAQESLEIGDVEGAIANITYALNVFREVTKAINTILRESGVPRGQLVDAQGLIQAMRRALDRIDRLEEIGELPEEAIEARKYLNITQAILDLQQGMVEETVNNLTQANRLISEAHKALKNTAAEMNTHRIRNFVKVMNNFRERLGRQIGKLEDSDEKKGLEDALGVAAGLITGAETLSPSEALDDLEEARSMLEEVEQGLKEQRLAEKGEGGGNGKGNGNRP